jgi:hypothetical protein
MESPSYHRQRFPGNCQLAFERCPKTFGRTVVQCSFLHWHALEAANQRIWETSYRLRPSYEPWDTWQGWMAEYRTLLATTQEVYEAQYGKRDEDQP